MPFNGDCRRAIEIVTATSLWKIAVPIRKIIPHESSTGAFPQALQGGAVV